MRPERSSASAPCPLVFACDEGYAMPLATALRSLAETNAMHAALQVHVLVDAFSASMRWRVERSLPHGIVDLDWIAVDLRAFDALATLPHISQMTFARLAMTRLMPAQTQRVLYLDADILVLGDLQPLWSTPLHGAALAAVRDHHVDSDLKAARTQRLQGVPAVRDYFNAGVLLVDLARWRQDRLDERALEYLRAYPSSAYADQDALNVACDGLWAPLEARWNFQDHHCTRLARLTGSQRPSIVHFVTSTKPWLPAATSVNAGLHDAFRQRTLFARTPTERAQAALTRWSCRIARRLGRGAARPARSPSAACAQTVPQTVAAAQRVEEGSA